MAIIDDDPKPDPLLEILYDLAMLKQKVEKIEQELEENRRVAKRQAVDLEQQKMMPDRLKG